MPVYANVLYDSPANFKKVILYQMDIKIYVANVIGP